MKNSYNGSVNGVIGAFIPKTISARKPIAEDLLLKERSFFCKIRIRYRVSQAIGSTYVEARNKGVEFFNAGLKSEPRT